MKKIIIAFSIISFILSCNKPVEETYVMKVVQYEVDNSGKIKEKGEVIGEYHYSKGKLLQKIIFDSTSSNRLVKKIFNYNSEGNDSCYLFTIAKTLSTKTDLHRDKFGNIILISSYDWPESSDTLNLVYSNILNEDSLSSSAKILSNGVLLPSNNLIEHVYDKQKRLIEKRTFTVSDTGKVLQELYQWKYDEKGNNTMVSNYNLVQNFKSKTEYEYGVQNEMQAETYIENAQVIYKINYKYLKSRKIEGTKTYLLSGKKFILKFIYE